MHLVHKADSVLTFREETELHLLNTGKCIENVKMNSVSVEIV